MEAKRRGPIVTDAFEGNCKKTVEYEQHVFDYYGSVKDFFQQGEIADEAARACIDSGDLDTAHRCPAWESSRSAGSSSLRRRTSSAREPILSRHNSFPTYRAMSHSMRVITGRPLKDC